MKFSVDEVVAATGGRLAAGLATATPWRAGRRDAPAGSISTNTRTLAAGQMFLAIRGERFDGHDFLEAAIRGGAACLIVSRKDRLPNLGSTAAVIVKDTLAALADLGRAARERLACPVIAVTGSCGKTTVKEMIGQILTGRLRGQAPPASFNNQIGVPLTLLGAETDDEFVLCEFGTNAPGEIAHLAGVARPTIGIVTVVAPVHLEGLGSVEGVAAEKSALVESLDDSGAAILNADDPRVAAMAAKCRGRAVTVGLAEMADLRLDDLIQTERGLHFTAADVGFDVPVLGEHQALLALLAAAAVREVGVPLEESAEALRGFHPPPMRLALHEAGGVTIVNDAYNANPRSMAAALAVLALWPDRRKVFFCGDMRELGPASRTAHEELGRAAVEVGVKQLICVGQESRATAVAAVAAGLKEDAVTMLADSERAAAMAPGIVREGDVVLVKGSRLIKMERVADAILAALAVSPR